MRATPSIHRSKHHRHGTRLVAGLAATPLGLGLPAGCTPQGTESLKVVVTEGAISRPALGSAEKIRLANALSWKRGISGDEAYAIIDKVFAKTRGKTAQEHNRALSTYRAIEREHEQYLRRERLANFDKANGGGGGGGGHAH